MMPAAMEQSSIRLKEIGRVVFVKKIIAGVRGLSSFMNGQLVDFAGGPKGLIVGFDKDEVMVLILGDESLVRIGQEVFSVQKEFKIPVGPVFVGRIVNALAEPVDGKEAGANRMEHHPVFREAPQTMDRAAAEDCLYTGTKIIDALVPIARGQRQMIIGDRMTGKTTVALDAIISQKGKDVICVYCCIGKSYSSLAKALGILKMNGAMGYSLVVAAGAGAPVAQQYLAPYSAAALGEYFFYKGRDVLVVFDDMTKHAWAWRQISLLLERPPGREAYPGDIYYTHSQLMERAGKLNQTSGGGSMTFLPVVDTLQQDVTGFIPSNLISMTDGQIYLNSSIFAEGVKPAVDLGVSVSILGSKAQNPLVKKLSGALRLELAQYKELLRLTKLKSSFSPEVMTKLRRGQAINAVFIQDKNAPVGLAELVVLLYALERKILDGLELPQISKFKNEIKTYLTSQSADLFSGLENAKELTPAITERLDGLLNQYIKQME